MNARAACRYETIQFAEKHSTMIRVMIVIIVNKGLEITYLYLFVTILTFNQGIKLNHGEISRTRSRMTFK